jgi:hypothetical protein
MASADVTGSGVWRLRLATGLSEQDFKLVVVENV